MALDKIKSINKIKNLHVFSDYSRQRDLPALRQLNLIYGFNGTGKTTLTYIFRSLSSGEICQKIDQNVEFEIELDSGSLITEKSALDHFKDKVMVFNEDFIEENLSWKNGTAKPVFFIGQQQIETIKKLDEKQAQYSQCRTQLEAFSKEFESHERQFSVIKRNIARTISENLNLGRGYDATNLSRDYSNENITDENILSEESTQKNRSTVLLRSPLAKRNLIKFSNIEIGNFIKKGRRIVEVSLGESASKDIMENESMLIWIKEGFEYHQEKKLVDCLFCGGPIGDSRIKLLGDILDGKMENLLNEVDDMREDCEKKISQFNLLLSQIPSENDIVDEKRHIFSDSTNRLKFLIAESLKAMSSLSELLEDKLDRPTKSILTDDLLNDDLAEKYNSELNQVLVEINRIIEFHNKSHDDFKVIQDSAKIDLKKHLLAVERITYFESQNLFIEAEKKKNIYEEELRKISNDLESIKQEVRRHGPAAEKINRLISNYLGHKELHISTLDEGYELQRNGKVVTGNLSEGEKTAIALCYFLCTLEADNKKLKDLIVVVDDPISSLDSKALNYAFSMLKSLLGGAGQLIILTHNLNFMNEVKKWLRNKIDGKVISPSQPTATLLFLEPVRGRRTRQTEIKVLPSLLREYESEYHYLFQLVLKYDGNPKDNEGLIMLMPNAMRKVLDVFLAFKYPGSNGFTGKIEQALKDASSMDVHRVRALDRLVQLESHSDNLDDLLSFSSMTVEETEAAAKALLDLLKILDEGHFNQITKICT